MDKGQQRKPGFLPFLEFWTSGPLSPHMATLSLQNSTTVVLETVKHDNIVLTLSIVGNLKSEILLIFHRILLITQTLTNIFCPNLFM